MGHAVHNIGQHNLDISSFEALAKDLSQRFQANVEYGAFDDFYFDWDGFFREPSYEFWQFGKVYYPGSQLNLMLIDQYYLYHFVYLRYGEDTYQLPCFVEDDLSMRELLKALNNVCYEFRDFENDIQYGIIFNDTFHDWYDSFSMKWYSFCRAFTEEDNDEYFLSEVMVYRRQVKAFFEKVGGTEAYYFDDQGESHYLTHDYYEWAGIKDEVKRNFKETTLNISEFLKDKRPFPKGEYPLAFFDDFGDL